MRGSASRSSASATCTPPPRRPFWSKRQTPAHTSSSANAAAPARTRHDDRLTAGPRLRSTAATGGATGTSGGVSAASPAAMRAAAASTLARTDADGPRPSPASACERT